MRILRASSTLVATVSALALLVVAANAADSLPARAAIQVAFQIGQAPTPIGQAPASAAPAAAAPSSSTATGTPVSFTDEQASRGEIRFKSTCIDCHGDNLQGGLNGGPPLKGVAFDQLFGNGSAASGLFGFMSTQMPPDSPGEFSPAVYADVMAYILKLNGYQPGAKELPSDSNTLDHLIMQK
jgi:mono/diheme cytochrome c family protein